MSLSTLRWLGLAAAGILVAVAVAVIASNLASRQIGLASEPVSAGDDLAPRVAGSHHKGDGHDEEQPGEGAASTESTQPSAGSGAESQGGPSSGGEPAGGADDSGGSGEGDEGGGRDD